jgi:hypothetical protein
MRVMAVAMLAICACGDERAASEGSVLEPPRQWQAEARAAAGTLDLHALALPPDVLSVTLVAQAQSAGSDELALGVRDGDGRWLVDPERPERSTNRVLRGHGRVVAVLPSSSAALPLAAEYLIAPALPSSGAPRPVTLSAWVKRGGGGRQELPLALVVAAAIDDGPIDIALAEVGRIWRAAGIEVREPIRFQVPAAQAESLARVEVDPTLAGASPAVASAVALSSLAPAGTLSLIVVGDLVVTGPGYPIWAVSDGIPVAPASDAAVVVSAVLLRHDPSWAGQVIAHEMGHALGLYHTTEAALDGAASVSDQIDDTPACPASADRSPPDQTLSPAECDAHDTANLMFWSAVRGATLLTGGQAAMARRSALAR